MAEQPLPPPPKAGDVIAGKYRVERVIGSGGMGIVVAAQHVQLDTRVAVKLLHPRAMDSKEAVTRFLREGQTASHITSEHVARVLDIGTLPDGAPYMVMEYLEGVNLSELLKRRGPLPIVEVVDYILQACEALAEAHAAGVIHRDLKPSNLFLTRRADGSPCVKLLDFGISKQLDTTGAGPEAYGLTTTGSGVLGSPLYMSPEQIRSARRVDARADVWSLGVILFELLAGEGPMEAENLASLLAAIMTDEPRPLRQLRPDAPLGLEAAIARCLVKKVDARLPSVSALAALLEPFGSASAKVSAERITSIARRSMPDATASRPSEGEPTSRGFALQSEVDDTTTTQRQGTPGSANAAEDPSRSTGKTALFRRPAPQRALPFEPVSPTPAAWSAPWLSGSTPQRGEGAGPQESGRVPGESFHAAALSAGPIPPHLSTGSWTSAAPPSSANRVVLGVAGVLMAIATAAIVVLVISRQSAAHVAPAAASQPEATGRTTAPTSPAVESLSKPSSATSEIAPAAVLQASSSAATAAAHEASALPTPVVPPPTSHPVTAKPPPTATPKDPWSFTR